jgi:predicted enzyme related to lactoylglutathione lyase
MPSIDKHAPGNFCWVELAATDQSAAQAFYAKIFGWSANNIPMGRGGCGPYLEPAIKE